MRLPHTKIMIEKGKNTGLSFEELQPSKVWKNKPQVRKKTKNHESQSEGLFQEKKGKYVK